MKRLTQSFTKKRNKIGAFTSKKNAKQPAEVVAISGGVGRANKPQQVRIIAGYWRGRKLPVANVNGLRPSNDRVRETLFNWLAPNLPGAKCLDLFTGSGALGFEALSRGAKQVDMVELSQVASQQLRDNLANLPLLEQQQAHIHSMSCFDWLRQQVTSSNCHNTNAHNITYDVVFVDPPFALALIEDTLQQLSQSPLVSTQALIYVEHSAPIKTLTLPTGWQIHRHKKAGQVHYGLLYKGLK